MKKLDSRIVRTRRALADSLVALALERGYENLTIRMVTEHAGVGNRTFYRHFLSLDDLLQQILKTALQELKERALLATTPQDEILAFYCFIKDHPDVLRVYVNLPQDHPARQAIMREAAKIMYGRYTQKTTTSAPLDLSIAQLISVTNHIVAWYLENIDDCSPEQAAAIHKDILTEALEHTALNLRDDWMRKRHQLLG